MTVTIKNLPSGATSALALAPPKPSAKLNPSKAAANAPYGRNDLFRDLAVVWIMVNLIDDNPRQVRRQLQKQEAAVRRSIERFGFRIPILVTRQNDKERYEVVDGHARLAAARLLGAEAIPCLPVDDLPETEIRRLTLSLNRLQECGEWDQAALKIEINELIEITCDFEIPGFEPPEIEAIRFGAGDGQESDPSDDLSPFQPDGPAVSEPGDLWILGKHRLWCGSARAGDDVQGMLAEVKADAVFTDPPYNVKISGNARSADAGFQEFAEASGEMSRDAFVAFLTETLGNAATVLRPGGVLFACMDWRHVGEMSETLGALGLDLLNICVWVKTKPGMGSLYRSQHELVFVARKPGGKHTNNVQLGQFGRNRSNVWHYAGATGGRSDPDDDHTVHPTVKPIRMVMDALLDMTAPGELVFDPFMGSGSTLLAAERTRRRCFGIEIEPAYVDVAIRRWQDITGGQAVHAETGQTFDARAAEMGGFEESEADARDRGGSVVDSGTPWEDF